ncbi:ER membrane complex subunit 1 [Lecanosticta acicola]|uniref:ER membrane protein complex subunit 1 n=1 Tax=Lecanosticta acicola TaxID=111012 RepID=A0AAI9EG28_9PEZI|nr:ER membrane complex subunit 1 [Lecanosticta acicola]
MHLAQLSVIPLLLNTAAAVFADEAYSLDYHYELLGTPKEDTTFFHQPNSHSRASLIYTLSESGVLGAVNPKDGALLWRQPLAPNVTSSNASFLRASDGQDIVLSGIGEQVAAWSAADGRLVWSQGVSGQIEDLEILELSDGLQTPGVKDAIVMSSGYHSAIQRLDGSSGAVKWMHAIGSGDLPYQVSASDTQVFGIFLHKTMLGNIKIRVIALDPVTGRKNDEYTLSSDSDLTSADTIVSVGANSASPIIAWTDSAYSVLKVNIIGSKSVASFNIDKHNSNNVKCVRLHAPSHPNSRAHFLVHYETEISHWGEVFHVDVEKNKVEKAYALPKTSGSGAFSTSTSDANVYFTRITRGQVMTVSSVSHGALGRWQLSDYSVAANEETEPIHAVSEVSVRGDSVSALRSAVFLSSGDWILVREGTPIWQRPEVLANTVAATFATPPEVEAFAHELEIEAHSNPIQAYVHRVKRHVLDWQRLPQVLSALPQSIRNGLFGTTADSGLTRDTFGFHKVIACATKDGRVIALDAGNPSRILWSKQAVTLTPGESWKPSFKAASDGVLVIESGPSSPGVKLNASTGEDVVQTADLKGSSLPLGSVQFTIRDSELEATRVGGAALGALWHFVPPNGERILSLVPRPVNDPVASIGKVLGDRRVLYKYLSPNMALLVTTLDESRSASFYVLDTVSGATLYADTHTDVDLSAPIPTIMSENWFAYSYTSESSDDTPKGTYLVVAEMFESLVPNDRGPLGEKTNSSTLETPPEPFVLSKSYQIPETISKLAVTQTKQGITSRQILAVLADSSSIVGIPYGIVDPRRPFGRDPTKDEQAEGLVKYAPTIEFDPKWYLNHRREVLGIKDIILSPALIESTSLVFAYGLDIFGTRLSPSFSFDILGKDFNKFQMLATVAALAVGTFIVAPLVSRKQVNARWQFA